MIDLLSHVVVLSGWHAINRRVRVKDIPPAVSERAVRRNLHPLYQVLIEYILPVLCVICVYGQTLPLDKQLLAKMGIIDVLKHAVLFVHIDLYLNVYV